jgi:hypothetical protein
MSVMASVGISVILAGAKSLSYRDGNYIRTIFHYLPNWISFHDIFSTEPPKSLSTAERPLKKQSGFPSKKCIFMKKVTSL